MDKKDFLERIEAWADMLIGPALIVIFILVILEVFFPDVAHHYHGYILLADRASIGVFMVDLSFKFKRASDWEGFIKDYWLEIIAIFPVFLVVRIFEILAFLRAGEVGQEVVHLVTRSERIAVLTRGSELSRSARVGSVLRGLARTPRLAKAAKFYDSPG